MYSTFLIIFLFIFSSCGLLKPKYFNQLDNKDKIKFIPQKINKNCHDDLDPGIYSINPDDFKHFIENSKTEYILYFSQHIHCFGIEPSLQEIYKRFGNKLTILSISSHDWVWKNDYEQYLSNHNFLKKCYLIENEIYGKYESWHENGTVWLRANKFLRDILNEKDLSKLDSLNNKEYVPPFILFDKKGNSLLEYDENICYNPQFEECKIHFDKLLEKINQIISK